ncbi:MAG: hypothetical protein K0S27_1379 [Gammaproteobacteria bacterium]|jgi:hypothetical protein|nr:hypothetical protein [Gammaproteobacteria bacterium]
MDARNSPTSPDELRSALLIKRVCFINEAKDYSEFERLIRPYPQSMQESNTLYILHAQNSMGHGFHSPSLPSFSIRWPTYLAAREEEENWLGVTPETAEAMRGGNDPYYFKKLYQQGTLCPAEGDWSKMDREVREAVAHAQKVINETAQIRNEKVVAARENVQAFSIDMSIQENITRLFGANMLASVKELRSVLFNGDRQGQEERLDFSKTNFSTLMYFSELVDALKQTPAKGITEVALQEQKQLEEIARAAEKLKHHLELGHYPEDEGLEIKRLIGRIIIAIAGAVYGAAFSFKAVAALGAMVGGGVLLAPAAVIGGCAGLLLGGGLGFFGGNKLANRLSTRCAEDYHGSIIDTAVKRAGVLPRPVD